MPPIKVSEFRPALRPQFAQSLFGSGERLFFLTKGKPDLRGAILCVVVETRARDDGNSDGFDEELRKTNVFRIGLKANGIGIRKTRDIRHDVIRAARLKYGEAGAFKNFEQPFALGGVRSGELVVIPLRKVQGAGAGLLERCSGANGQ